MNVIVNFVVYFSVSCFAILVVLYLWGIAALWQVRRIQKEYGMSIIPWNFAPVYCIRLAREWIKIFILKEDNSEGSWERFSGLSAAHQEELLKIMKSMNEKNKGIASDDKESNDHE